MRFFEEKEKHKPIINWFLKNGFGTNMPILTYFSTLSPIDRCVILESLMANRVVNVEVIDKLILAYVKAGYREHGEYIISLLKKSNYCNDDYFIAGIESKLDIAIPPYRSDEERIEYIRMYRSQTENELELEFLELLDGFIMDNGPKEVNLNLAKALFETETIHQAKLLYTSEKQRQGLRINDSDFRLYKTEIGTINLEYLTFYEVGERRNSFNDLLGNVIESRMIGYFQPIGFYTFENQTLESITYLNEILEPLEILVDNCLIDDTIIIRELSLSNNAIIGAFSIQGYFQGIKGIDTKFRANELDFEIFISESDQPIAWLDDKYDFLQGICIYPNMEGGPVDVVTMLKEEFDQLEPYELFNLSKIVGT